MGPLTPAIGAALCLSGNALANTDIYQATITGTFTEVDFDSVDPGALVDLGAGDSYALTITTEITGDVARAPGIASYDILSVELAIFDGSGMTYVTPLALSALRVEIGAAYSFLGFAQGVSASPFDSARLSLLDSDGDPILGDTALPLSLDLDAFDEQREFSLFGVLDTELDPKALEGFEPTVETTEVAVFTSTEEELAFPLHTEVARAWLQR